MISRSIAVVALSTLSSCSRSQTSIQPVVRSEGALGEKVLLSKQLVAGFQQDYQTNRPAKDKLETGMKNSWEQGFRDISCFSRLKKE